MENKKQKRHWVGLPKGTACTVEPIREPAKVKAIKKLLHDNPRDRLFFVLGCNCGLRGADLLRLTVGQFMGVKENDIVKVLERKTQRDPDKHNGKSRRAKLNEIVINSSILKELKAYFKARPDAGADEPLFKSSRGSGPITSRAMAKRVKAWCEAVGAGKCGINSLRKTFAYHQIVHHGQPVNRITAALNHSDTATTLRYCGASRDEVRNMRRTIIV